MFDKLARVLPPMSETLKARLFEVARSPKMSILHQFFSGGEYWRQGSIQKTIKIITDEHQVEKMHQYAAENLECWSQNKQDLPGRVQVVKDDWGGVTQALSEKHGKIYAVLNFASHQFPGGSFLERGTAQEENIWHRTTCSRSLDYSGVVYDTKKHQFKYDETMQRLISAQTKMSPAELEILTNKMNRIVLDAFKVFFDTNPQVCFRGQEVLIDPSVNEYLVSDHGNLHADSDLSFKMLPKQSIFSFYEMRSAAPILAFKQVNWDSTQFRELYIADVRRRISAQLDTLIVNGIDCAVIGAWGCGAYQNNPHIIAQVYAEEITNRAHLFSHVVFPIIHHMARDAEHYEIFHEYLDGLELKSSQPPSELQQQKTI